MQVARWGNSLAVRLPAGVVEALGLKEGDDIDIRVVGDKAFAVDRKLTLEERLAAMRRSRGRLGREFHFSREDAHAR